ncbi:MAG: hypothetical protein IPJ06_00515 [Saprospiraceae bacterium]|nr:hypothetical protein [Saprospiraceae bacterium]
MSLDLTKLEKKAVAKVLLDIVNADGRVTVGESSYFQQLQNVLGISDSEIEEAKYMSVTGSLSIIKDLLPHEKAALAIMMYEMIHADGEAHKEELKVFAVVCIATDIPLPK